MEMGPCCAAYCTDRRVWESRKLDLSAKLASVRFTLTLAILQGFLHVHNCIHLSIYLYQSPFIYISIYLFLYVLLVLMCGLFVCLNAHVPVGCFGNFEYYFRRTVMPDLSFWIGCLRLFTTTASSMM